MTTVHMCDATPAGSIGRGVLLISNGRGATRNMQGCETGLPSFGRNGFREERGVLLLELEARRGSAYPLNLEPWNLGTYNHKP